MAEAITLLCLPCAGASATMYLRWRRHLPPWLRLVPAELPGRGGRLAEPFTVDFDRLVAQVCDEHADVLDGPFALFGHSMGALLAHGVARRRHALGGRPPVALLVSASPAPACRDPGRYAGLQDDAALVADLRRQGGTPDEVFVSPDLMRITLDVLRADYRVCASHRHRAAPPLPVPLHVFAGRHDDIAADRIDPWRDETARGFSIDWFDGGHFYLRAHEDRLLAALVQRLADAAALRTPGPLAAA